MDVNVHGSENRVVGSTFEIHIHLEGSKLDISKEIADLYEYLKKNIPNSASIKSTKREACMKLLSCFLYAFFLFFYATVPGNGFNSGDIYKPSPKETTTQQAKELLGEPYRIDRDEEFENFFYVWFFVKSTSNVFWGSKTDQRGRVFFTTSDGESVNLKQLSLIDIFRKIEREP